MTVTVTVMVTGVVTVAVLMVMNWKTLNGTKPDVTMTICDGNGDGHVVWKQHDGGYMV